MEAARVLLSAASKKVNLLSTLGHLLRPQRTLLRAAARDRRALEAEKSSLRSAVSAMSSALWTYREDLFAIASAADDRFSSSSSPQRLFIPLSRLRAIYGEEEPPSPSSRPESAGGEVTAKEPIIIS